MQIERLCHRRRDPLPAAPFRRRAWLVQRDLPGRALCRASASTHCSCRTINPCRVCRGRCVGCISSARRTPRPSSCACCRARCSDVAVDLRRGSASYGRWCSAHLSAEGGEQLFIPRGFAHGFLTLAPDTAVQYKVDDVYAPECDTGLLWDDADLAIAWPLDGTRPHLSDKDMTLPRFCRFRHALRPRDAMSRTFLVTGGAGFIGSAVVRHLIARTDHRVCVVDKLTYAGNLDNLTPVARDPRFRLIQADICDAAAMGADVADAAAGRGDASCGGKSCRSLDRRPRRLHRDERNGHVRVAAGRARALAEPPPPMLAPPSASTTSRRMKSSAPSAREDRFTETSPYAPNSPYSASKAASDHLLRAWHHTFGLPTILSNCSNNYGPYHFPEKLIPLAILNALEGKAIPVYGDGANVRDWLYVEDHAAALVLIAERGRIGDSYNVGGRSERSNLEVLEQICALVDAHAPHAARGACKNLINFVPDRPGHDRRYAIDATKLERELGWTQGEDVRHRPRQDRALVHPQCRLVGTHPLGRLPRRAARDVARERAAARLRRRRPARARGSGASQDVATPRDRTDAARLPTSPMRRLSPRRSPTLNPALFSTPPPIPRSTRRKPTRPQPLPATSPGPRRSRRRRRQRTSRSFTSRPITCSTGASPVPIARTMLWRRSASTVARRRQAKPPCAPQCPGISSSVRRGFTASTAVIS